MDDDVCYRYIDGCSRKIYTYIILPLFGAKNIYVYDF